MSRRVIITGRIVLVGLFVALVLFVYFAARHADHAANARTPTTLQVSCSLAIPAPDNNWEGRMWIRFKPSRAVYVRSVQLLISSPNLNQWPDR